MRNPQPRVVLPQLRDQVVGDKAHRRRQSVQHDGDKRLQTRQGKSSRFSDSARRRVGRRKKEGIHLEGEKHGARSDGEGEDVGNRAHDQV